MTNIKEEVQKNIKELQQVKLELEEKIKNEPEGSLRISRSSAGKPRYYHKYMNKDNETVDSFTGDEQLVQKLAEKSYYHKMLSCVEKELQALKNFEKHYFPEKKTDIYRQLSPERKSFVDAIYLPEELRAEQWEKQQWKKYDKFTDGLRFETDRGEIVRSKSEIIIANMLNKKSDNLSYRYEAELYLKKANRIVHPDFTILNKKNGKIYYWEHIGMLGNQIYSNDFVRKANDYIEDGIIPGKQLILTYETKDEPLNIQVVKMLVEEIVKS